MRVVLCVCARVCTWVPLLEPSLCALGLCISPSTFLSSQLLDSFGFVCMNEMKVRENGGGVRLQEIEEGGILVHVQVWVCE